MQRLIDANKLDITTIQTDDYSGNEILDVVLKEDIDDASTILSIPEHPTNGDMIEAMYCPYKVCEHKYAVHIYLTEEDFIKADYQMNFDVDWWNSPYKTIERLEQKSPETDIEEER